MHPSLGADDFEHISHLDLDRIYERPTPVHIEHSHSTNMASEVSLSDLFRRTVDTVRESKALSQVLRGD